MKKRIIGATLITVVCALLISNLVGVLLFRSREMDAARNTLQELLVPVSYTHLTLPTICSV